MLILVASAARTDIAHSRCEVSTLQRTTKIGDVASNTSADIRDAGRSKRRHQGRRFGSLQKHWQLVLLVVVAFVVSSCRADIAIQVDVQDDGSGTVAVELLLDQEAAEAVVDLERSGLALSDMAQAGWRIGATEEVEGGGARIVAEKDFGTATQFADIMQEISGEDGIFQNFELERNRSFARVEYNVTGQINTTDGFERFSDRALEDLLEITVEQAAEDYAVSPEKVGIEFSVLLPGDITEGDTNGLTSIEDDKAIVRWAVDLASDKTSQVQATSETRKVSALVLRGLAVVAAALAVLLIVSQLFRQFGNDGSKRKPKPKSVSARTGTSSQPDASASTASETDEQAGTEPDRTHTTKAVVLDGMGVLYKEGDDINKLLIPFVRERGSIQTNAEIWSKARAMSLGRLTTTQFWKDVGLEGDAVSLDAEYVANHQLSPGVIRYMRALRGLDVKVGCVVNGATTWAEGLRKIHSLETLIDPWIVSGSVGVRKPDMPLLEVVRRLCELPPSDIRIIDDDLEILDVVRKEGYLTSWYNPEGTAEEARGHSVIRSFEAEATRLTALTSKGKPVDSPDDGDSA